MAALSEGAKDESVPVSDGMLGFIFSIFRDERINNLLCVNQKWMQSIYYC